MCGIVAVVGNKNPTSIILNGLKKLEYRGYDSAGIALIENGEFKIVKEEGKIAKLESSLKRKTFKANIAIGHTRWATHGKPSKKNAHPHASKNVCVVHNGIIENYQAISKNLSSLNYKLISETDSEILPNLVEHNFSKSKDFKKSIIESIKEVKGTFAIATIFKSKDDTIFVAKKGSPLVIGIGENENYIASDYYALSDYTNKIIVLNDGEFATITAKSVEVFNEKGETIKKEIKEIEQKFKDTSKAEYKHFMLKEIHEQPKVIEEIIETYVDLSNNSIHLPKFDFDLKQINKITIVACGTSYYAGLAAKYLIEDIAKIEVEVDIASEFRYRSHPFRSDNLMIFISQSGETADTLAALQYAKKNQQKILSIVNASHSTMSQLSDAIIMTVAGKEIGVASTKAYTAQIAILSLFAIHLGLIKKVITDQEKNQLLSELIECKHKINSIFEKKDIKNIKQIAQKLSKAKNILYIGRGISQVTAFESSLKLRELSYINSQGIAAGELKHGTIALIDKNMFVIVIAPDNNKNDLFEKTLSNAQEVNARGGKIIFIGNKKGISKFGKMSYKKIEIPDIEGIIQEAIVSVVPSQLLSYYVAFFKGHDVDQPRNLAKSVTVE